MHRTPPSATAVPAAAGLPRPEGATAATSPLPACPAAAPACASSSLGTIASGLLGLLLAGWAVFGAGVFGPPANSAAATRAVLALILATGGAMLAWELAVRRVHRQALVDRPQTVAVNWGRVWRKWLGLQLTLGVLALLYATLPEYRKPLYRPFLQLAELAWPWIVAVSLPYLAWVDARMAQPRDALHALGDALLRGRWPALDAALVQHALAWAVKGFFVPLMLGYAVRQVQGFPALIGSAAAGLGGFRPWFDLAFSLLYLIDVVWGAVGYLFALRLVDSHVRSTEGTAAGWAVALACYEPVSNGLWPAWLAYDPGRPWGQWLGGLPLLYVAWGSAILAATAVYTAATVSFGLRFSNLTHRGIVDIGPYRWLQHPAYWSKNLSWWLISMPFMVGTSWVDSLRHCALLLLVNGLYALRAWTEARHLGQDPAYRAYVAALRQRQRAWRRRWLGLGAAPTAGPAEAAGQGA